MLVSPHAPLAAQPSTRRRAAPKPRKAGAPRLSYPEPPDTPHNSGGRVSHAEFNRAAFLRHLAQHRGAAALFSSLFSDRKWSEHEPTLHFMAHALNASERQLRENFAHWMQSCGGLLGTGAVEVLQ